MKNISILIAGLLLTLSAHATEVSDVEIAIGIGIGIGIGKYYESVKVYDTVSMSNLMHPQALKKFRTTITNALMGNKKELAKRELLPLFSVRNLSQYNMLTDKAAYKRLNDVIAKAQPKTLTFMKSSQFEIVNVAHKNDLAYVSYTLTMNINGLSASKDIVQRLKLHDGNWLLLLPPDGEAAIAGIKARFE